MLELWHKNWYNRHISKNVSSENSPALRRGFLRFGAVKSNKKNNKWISWKNCKT